MTPEQLRASNEESIRKLLAEADPILKARPEELTPYGPENSDTAYLIETVMRWKSSLERYLEPGVPENEKLALVNIVVGCKAAWRAMTESNLRMMLITSLLGGKLDDLK